MTNSMSWTLSLFFFLTRQKPCYIWRGKKHTKNSALWAVFVKNSAASTFQCWLIHVKSSVLRVKWQQIRGKSITKRRKETELDRVKGKESLNFVPVNRQTVPWACSQGRDKLRGEGVGSKEERTPKNNTKKKACHILWRNGIRVRILTSFLFQYHAKWKGKKRRRKKNRNEGNQG